MKKISFVLLSFAFFAAVFSCNKKENNAAPVDEPLEIAFIKEGDLTLSNNDSIIKNVEIEIATDSNERAIGLMNRSSMKENRGMLFIFDQENNSGFWMKDTRIPLDIIFVGADSTVINVQNAKAYDRHSYEPAAPYRYVLEVNGGMAEKWGVKPQVTKLSWKKL